MDRVKDLFSQVDKIKKEYEVHFKSEFPDRIIGWWDPVNIINYPDELATGVENMRKDVQKAIKDNTPIKNMSEEEWNRIVF